MTQPPYVHSNYERRELDHYPTIDPRCIDALLATWPIQGRIVDVCAPQGSGIVDRLVELGRNAVCDDFDTVASWVVTNPPYKRGLVDEIAAAAVAHVSNSRVQGAAFLMRASWDLAACRSALFASPMYAGQTRMRFRPWWSEERKAQPIHNYVWHVWTPSRTAEPVVRYWP
jgi:hypothetical protein